MPSDTDGGLREHFGDAIIPEGLGRREAADWHSGALTCYKLLSWANGGITMLRYRLALVAAGILLLTAPSAWAFSQQNTGSSGDGNSSFTDPDDQITKSFGVRPLD